LSGAERTAQTRDTHQSVVYRFNRRSRPPLGGDVDVRHAESAGTHVAHRNKRGLTAVRANLSHDGITEIVGRRLVTGEHKRHSLADAGFVVTGV